MLSISAVTEQVAGTAAVAPASTGARRLALAAVVAALLFVYIPTIAWLFGRWTMSVWHHAHGLFMPPLVAWLVARELKLRRNLPAGSSVWGFALLVPALALHVLDTGIQTQLLSALSLFLALPGLALLFLGWPRTRGILFPLLFLVFALPIPLAFTENVHLALRHITTDLVTSLLSAAGVSVFAEGTTVVLANATLQIADACSGFSTLYASLAFALLLAYFTRSKRRFLVLAAAVPLAIGANVMRMFALFLLTVWRGPQILDTFIHPLSGMATFALTLPLLLWIGSDRQKV